MKVLFTNPPWYQLPAMGKPGWRGVRAGSRWPHTYEVHSCSVQNGIIGELVGGYLPFPVWLATTAAFARKEGFNTVIRDSLSMGETYESFYAFVKSFAPDVVVLESSTPTVYGDLEIAVRIKELVPNAKMVFTGLHMEFEQEDFLKNHPEIDFTIYGEYEVPTIKLLCALRDGTSLSEVPALVYRYSDAINGSTPESDLPNSDVGQVRKTPFAKLPDLSLYPWAERDGLPNLNYFDGVCGLERPQLQLMATRGCPFGCIFCAWPQMLFREPRYRKRSAQDVVDEILANLAKIPYKSIYIDDDTFNISREYVVELASKLLKAGIGGKIPWSTMGRADLMDRPTLEALRDAGLFSIKYGVESADQGILDEIDKRMSFEQNIEMIRLTKELGIRVHLTFTFGLPSDTVETIEKTIALACSLPVDTAQFSIATPFPGTEMYRMYDQRGWIISKNWNDYNGSAVAVSRSGNFSPEQLESIVSEAYRRFDRAQVDRCFSSGDAQTRIQEAAAKLPAGASVLVLQSARVHLTRWLVSTLQAAGLNVHVAAAARFKDEFLPLLPHENIHTFSGSSHFNFDLLHKWAQELNQRYRFHGAFIPYTFDSRAGYEDVERLAVAMAGQILAGVTQRGTIFSFAT